MKKIKPTVSMWVSAGQSHMDGRGSGLRVGVINERLAEVWACECGSALGSIRNST